MEPKRPLSSPGTSTKQKKHRKSLTLEQKMEILDRYEKGQKTSVISQALGVTGSTLRTVRQNAGKIKASVQAGTSKSAQRSSYSRPVVVEKIEKMLTTWIEHENKQNTPINMAIIQEKAKSLMHDIGTEEEAKNFQASRGWFDNFKKRQGFHNIKMTGEAASADAEAAKLYPDILKKILEEGEYSAKQVFNVDETGLYWKKMPNRTYIMEEEKTAPGFKASKDRLTLLLGSNAEGDCKLKPLMIYHSENPRALKVRLVLLCV